MIDGPATSRRPGPPSGATVLLLLLVALAARAITFGDPIVHADEEFYFSTAHAMWRGAVPYVDIWDRKPLGLFLLYLPAAALPWPIGIYVYQAMAYASVVATAALIVRLAVRAGWTRGAVPGGIAYIVWIDLAEGQGGQAPIFFNLLVIGAAALAMGSGGARAQRMVPAMLLVGLALQVKYSVVFEGAYFGLWAMAQRWRADRRVVPVLAHGAVLAIVALLPTLAVAAWYAHAGQFDAFAFANFRSILLRRPDGLAEQAGNFAGAAAILSPLVALAVIGFRSSERTPARIFLFGWAAAALVGLIAFGSWFDHYTLPAMVPLAICAAGPLGDHPRIRRWAVPLLILVAIGGQGLLIGKRLGRGTPTQFVALAQAVGRGPGCLWVQSGSTMLYAFTDRCAVSAYVFPSHLGRMREQGAVGVDQMAEVRRILAAEPAVIVMRPAYRGERADIRAYVEAKVAAAYRLKARLPLGNQRVRVFVPRQAVATRLATSSAS